MSFFIPNELLEHISRVNYVDRDAKVRQHFRLLFVNKQWHRYFDSDSVWKTLFSLFYLPSTEITMDFMKQMIRTKYSLKAHCKCMSKILDNPKWLLKYKVNGHPIKPNQVPKLQKLLDGEKVPREVEDDFVRHLSAIDEKKKLFSKMTRTKKDFELVKTPCNK
jgi:hypothetical protein